ncbi:MAG: hypothetical protein EZS28_051147, partial [Streblomastix strix]
LANGEIGDTTAEEEEEEGGEAEEPFDAKEEKKKLLEQQRELVSQRHSRAAEISEAVCAAFQTHRVPIRHVPAERMLVVVEGYIRAALRVHLSPPPDSISSSNINRQGKQNEAERFWNIPGSRPEEGSRDSLLLHAYSVPAPLAVHFLST